MSYNAKNDSLKLEDIKTFLENYYLKNNCTPRLSDWKEKNGFPCNKEYLLKKFGKYNELLQQLGYEIFSYGKRRYNKEQLLNEYKEAIIEQKTKNIDEIRKTNKIIKSKKVYIKIFDSIENLLVLLNIENRHIYLLNTFKDYELQDPIIFLKQKFGHNNDFTIEQKELINQISKAVEQAGDIRRDKLKNLISLHKCKKLFSNFTLALIAAGFNPCVKIGKKHIAKDGHMCDSYEEMLLDNLLIELNIPHDVHIKYPEGNYKCDFYINEYLIIEYTGYSNIKNKYLNNRYNERLNDKLLIAKKYNIKVLIISNIEEAREKLAVALHSDMH